MHKPQSEPLQLDVAVMHSFEVLRGRVSYVVARLATDSCLATSRYHLSPLFTRRRKAQHIYKQLRPSIAPLSSSATSDSFPRELRHAQLFRYGPIPRPASADVAYRLRSSAGPSLLNEFSGFLLYTLYFLLKASKQESLLTNSPRSRSTISTSPRQGGAPNHERPKKRNTLPAATVPFRVAESPAPFNGVRDHGGTAPPHPS
ncbi:hypothetical protein BGZ61DRAFT_544074 [Ilyonectria robusta]|uniref:uncharacterized protein n=1 Tax=Ilyonectria robusta TaxID=1079257 RepID=UPI001E8D659F|nr:uncharacterized protein BGZ61DRAFT_544074 [Ilyonectria robusta]KAH8737871.1 hypothetical protein BGZ61DRAFT_544074 [Ilyonectria robusta]